MRSAKLLYVLSWRVHDDSILRAVQLNALTSTLTEMKVWTLPTFLPLLMKLADDAAPNIQLKIETVLSTKSTYSDPSNLLLSLMRLIRIAQAVYNVELLSEVPPALQKHLVKHYHEKHRYFR